MSGGRSSNTTIFWAGFGGVCGEDLLPRAVYLVAGGFVSGWRVSYRTTSTASNSIMVMMRAVSIAVGYGHVYSVDIIG